MYALALDIEGSDAASDDLKRAARSVVGTLSRVIDLPIADARILGRAQKRFEKMVGLLNHQIERDRQAIEIIPSTPRKREAQAPSRRSANPLRLTS